MGCLLVFNYYMVMTFFPAAIILREKYFKGCIRRCSKRCGCCACNQSVENAKDLPKEEAAGDLEKVGKQQPEFNVGLLQVCIFI